MIRLRSLPEAAEEEQRLSLEVLEVVKNWGARPGDIITVAAPGGDFHRARFLGPDRGVRIFERLPRSIEPPFRRRLAQALPDRERMSWIVQKAVELGATEIQPVATGAARRSKSRQDKSGSWPRIALRAARQCRRARIPQVHPIQEMNAFLDANDPDGLLVILDPAASHGSFWRMAGDLVRAPVTLLVGHEGGWNEAERAVFQQRGAVFARLGHRILRTETAGLAALAVLAAADESFTIEKDL